MFPTIMDGNRVAQKFRENRGAAGPSLDDFLFLCSVQRFNFFQQTSLDIKGPFLTDLDTLYASFQQTLLFRSAFQDQFRRSFLVLPGTSTEGALTPRSNRTLTTNRGVTFTTTMRMVVRVHCHTTVGRTDTQPAGTTSFTQVQVFVIQVTDLTDGCTAENVYLTQFAGRHTAGHSCLL